MWNQLFLKVLSLVLIGAFHCLANAIESPLRGSQFGGGIFPWARAHGYFKPALRASELRRERVEVFDDVFGDPGHAVHGALGAGGEVGGQNYIGEAE